MSRCNWVIGAEFLSTEEDVKMRTSNSGLGFALTLAFAAQAHAAEIDWTKVDATLGKTASVQGEVHR
jgi:hypothetical protein